MLCICFVFNMFADIDECATNADNCHVKADCTNTIGSFTCKCRAGYEGNGTVCVGMFDIFIY